MAPTGTTVYLARRWFEQQLRPLLTPYGVDRYYNPPPEHQLRLLNWRQWSLRYTVPLSWIVERVMRYYAKARQHARRSGGLGLAVPTVTGEGTRLVIEQMLAEEFPLKENIEVARSRQRDAMLRTPVAFAIKAATVVQYVHDYTERAEHWRNQRAVASQRFKRPWRGNPWL